jgi:hypothetical protein
LTELVHRKKLSEIYLRGRENRINKLIQDAKINYTRLISGTAEEGNCGIFLSKIEDSILVRSENDKINKELVDWLISLGYTVKTERQRIWVEWF